MVKKSTAIALFYIGKVLPLFSNFSLGFSNLLSDRVKVIAAG